MKTATSRPARPNSRPGRPIPLLLVSVLVAGVMAVVAAPPPATAQSAPAGVYVPLKPARIFDTQAGGGGVIAAKTSRDVQITGRGGVPTTDVVAVVVDLTVYNNNSGSWGLLWAQGTTMPVPASSINYHPGRVVTNSVTTKLGTTGKASFYTWDATDMLIDVVGYYRAVPGGGGYVPLTQARVMDTAGTKLAANSTIDRKLRGVAGIPDSPSVTAVVMNATVHAATGPGPLTVWPKGVVPRPDTSVMNYSPTTARSEMVTATLSADGWASIWTWASIELLLDVVGYYTTGSNSTFVPLTPKRIIDTRAAFGVIGPISQALAPNTNTVIKVTGTGGVPETGVGTVMINVVADATQTATASQIGFLTVWASGDPQPGTLSLSYYGAENDTNLMLAKVGTDGKINIYNYYASTHLVIDVVGYFNAEPDPASDPLQRAGAASFFTHDTYALNDRMTASVNVGTGNLMVTTADMAIPVVGGARVLGRTYNSLALAPGASSPASPLFGPAWRFSEAPDRKLKINSNGSVTYLSGSGHAVVFAAGTLAAPPEFDAKLVKKADGSYELTFAASRQVLTFRSDGLMTSDVDRNGNAITFTYPASGGYETSIAGNAGAAPGNVATISYENPGGKVTRISKTDGTTTLKVDYTYDASGRLREVIDADGTTTFEYYGTNDLWKITDAAGHVTEFVFDGAHRVTRVTRVIDEGNAVTQYQYGTTATTPPKPTTTVTDPNGNPPTVYTFLADGRLERAVDARNVQTVVNWAEPWKRVASVQTGMATAPPNDLTKLLDTVWNLLAGATTPDLEEVKSPTGAFTKAGGFGSGVTAHLPGWTRDTMGFQTDYTYDPKGNLKTAANAATGTAKVERNPDGTVWKSFTPKWPDSNPTLFEYLNHQLTSVDPPGDDLGKTKLTYDAFGRVKTSTSGQTTASGQEVVTTFTYDGLGRVKTETHSDSTPPISYIYDAAGNLKSRTDGSGTTTYTYDKANRLLSKTGGLTYSWYPAGNLKTATDPGGTTTYHYDILNRLDQVDEASGRRTLYRYDHLGRRTDTWYNTNSNIAYDPNTGDVIPPVNFAAHTRADYDLAGQLTELRTTRASSDSQVVSHLKYSYDVPSGACPVPTDRTATAIRHQVTDVLAADKKTTYCYDQAGRLKTAATNNGGPTYSYTFDANTNRMTGPEGSHTVNLVDQLTDAGFDYDNAGNLTVGGNLSALTYNGINQTKSIATGGVTTDYSYAGPGQDERTTVDPSTAGPTTALHGMLGLASETTAGAATFYIRDAGGALIYEKTPAAGDFYYVYDGQGSVIALVDPAGTQRAAYTYDPYGDHATATAMNGAPPPNPWRWSGSYLDATGLYKMGARYYDPTRGRFTQVDPVPRGSCNYYDYACGDPVNGHDRSGTAMERDARLDELCGFGATYDPDAIRSDECTRYRNGVAAQSSDIGNRTFSDPGKPNAFLTSAAKVTKAVGANAAEFAAGCISGLWAFDKASAAVRPVAATVPWGSAAVAAGYAASCVGVGAAGVAGYDLTGPGLG